MKYRTEVLSLIDYQIRTQQGLLFSGRTNGKEVQTRAKVSPHSRNPYYVCRSPYLQSQKTMQSPGYVIY